MGSSWGVSRTMAQVNALLLVSPAPMTTEDIMEASQISRGNVDMSVRDLMDWDLLGQFFKVIQIIWFFPKGNKIFNTSYY